MRILLVVHDFLPDHPSGAEIYTWQLGLGLRARGHQVHVFTTDKDISRPNLTVRLREWDGLPVHELTNNLFYNEFRETWDYPPAARSFGLLLDDLRPDVVHFMHLMYLSVACVEEVARRGIPSFLTLHDYWLQCARFGQRIHAEGTLCHTIDFQRCGNCLVSFKYRQTRLERGAAKLIAGLRRRTGIDLGPLARGLGRGLQARLRAGEPSAARPGPEAASATASEYRPPPADQARAMAEQVAQRDRALRERLLPLVHRFIAPSNFLRQRFLEWGIPPERLAYMRTGIDLDSMKACRREPSECERVRVAFIGTLAPHKGVHVLLRAWDALPRELRARAELRIHGPKAHNPAYLRELERLCARSGALLAGGLEREEVPRVLGRVDLLVVPSIWFENSPLIILEALATRTPLLVSDLGGMAELVEEGVSGFHFRVGDVEHLTEVLGRLIAGPDELRRLHRGEPRIQDVSEDARILEGLYREACARPGEVAAP